MYGIIINHILYHGNGIKKYFKYKGLIIVSFTRKRSNAWLIIPLGSSLFIMETFPTVPEQLIIKSFSFTWKRFIFSNLFSSIRKLEEYDNAIFLYTTAAEALVNLIKLDNLNIRNIVEEIKISIDKYIYIIQKDFLKESN